MDTSVVPAVRINSGVEFRRVPTYLISATGTDSSYQLWDDPWENAKLPELSPLDPEEDGSFCEAMNNRLRDHSVQPLAYTTTSLSDFWPAKLFDHLFGYQEVCEIVNELVNDDISDGESPNGNPTDIIYHGKKDKNLPFRKVFAVLLLSGLQNLIHKFIAADVSDQELPLRADNRIFKQWKWKRTHVDMFRLYQWKLLVPFLGPSTDPGQLSQVEIRSEDICPWKRTSTSPRESCATVYQILVHPWQHGFQETLQEYTDQANVFALKVLGPEGKETFDQETKMLHGFGGRSEHIVRLFMTIQRETEDGMKYMFLLPWADTDLAGYWSRAKRPHSHECFKWITEQCHGLAHAIQLVHEPPDYLDKDGKQLYGRHGDLKPENILWFKRGGRGLLAISDMGLTEVHRDVSRSNIRGGGLPVTPAYRAPECDMSGRDGHVSRSFDIWTLGCVFLEYIIWILEGKDAVKEFRKERNAPYLGTNLETDIFYDILLLPEDRYAFKIKDSVAQRIIDLHNHADCTELIHDWLDLIQQRMLVVQSNDPPITRIKAAGLVLKMAAIRDGCYARESSCLVPRRQDTTPALHPYIPVEAPLSEEALKSVGKGLVLKMAMFRGETRSMRLS